MHGARSLTPTTEDCVPQAQQELLVITAAMPANRQQLEWRRPRSNGPPLVGRTGGGGPTSQRESVFQQRVAGHVARKPPSDRPPARWTSALERQQSASILLYPLSLLGQAPTTEWRREQTKRRSFPYR